MDVDRVQLHEVSEREPLVLEHLDRIEKGLRPLDNQVSVGATGRPDILAVDENGALTLLELKSVPADLYALAQTIRYYEWFFDNLALIARPFPSVKPDNGVRIFLVAPKFGEEVIRVARYLDLDIALVRYFAIRHGKSGDLGIIFEMEDIEPVQGPGVDFRSVEDILGYCIDPRVSQELDRVKADLRELGVEFRPYEGGRRYWVECTSQGEDVAYFQPRRKYFNFQFYDPEKDDYIWPPKKLTSYDEWVKQCKKNVTKSLASRAG